MLLRALLAALLILLSASLHAEPLRLRVAVLDNSPPMSYRDGNGELTGFSYAIARALCQEIGAKCEFHVTTLDRVVDALALDEYDVAAVSLLSTPERRRKALMCKPYFRSFSVWFARHGVKPGQPGVRIAVVRGSAQEAYAQAQHWETVGVATNNQLLEPLSAGVAQAIISPMITSFNLAKLPAYQQLLLESTVMREPGLSGEASFAVNPRRPEVRDALDEALERIKRNGTYDRINSQFLPFRVN